VTVRSRVALGLLLAIAVVLVLFGVGDIASGPDADPAITVAVAGRPPGEVRAAEPTGYRLYDFAIRASGLNLAVIGVLMVSILAVPYRSGVRWAWATMWVLPAWAVAVPVLIVGFGPAPGTALPPPAISGPILAGVAALALLLDRRRFATRPTPAPSLELGSATAA
jgi:hypothetical protein